MIQKSKRLMLRNLCETDFEDLCDILCDEEVMHTYAHPFTREEVGMWLKSKLLQNRDDGTELWAMIRLEDEVMVGVCGITLQKVHEEDVWEIGYYVKKAYWNQGYAKEAAKACKWYAFDTLNLPCVYSIIHEDNEASLHVAYANHMKVCDHIIKQYDHKEVPYVVLCVKNHKYKEKPSFYVYIDAEFDAVKINHKFHQRVISIGAVMSDTTGKELGRFYETIYPQQFQRLTRVVHRMTKLDDETIRSSKSLQEVLQEFSLWMSSICKKRKQIQMFSFGPDDKRTILQHCAFEGIDAKDIFREVCDVQKLISPHVLFQNKMISPTLSLDDMKLVYNIQGEVEHNALTDALDLMAIHVAYYTGVEQDEDSIQGIVNRKIQKQIESRKKQQAHFCRVIQERFKSLPHCVSVPFYQEVFDQFYSWQQKDEHFKWQFKKNCVKLEEQVYSYEDISMKLFIDTVEEIPSVTLKLIAQDQIIEKKYILNYHNATPVENILKRAGTTYE